MDLKLKLKGSTWVGNIYHRFEAMCEDVNGLATKDTVKFVENQVHTVGESVKKIYSNVFHDFIPVQGDNKHTKAMTKEQNDETGASIRSMTEVEEKPAQAEEVDIVGLRACVSSEVDSLTQSSPTFQDISEDKESDWLWEEGCDATSPETEMVVKDVGMVNYPEFSHLNYPGAVNSCASLPYRREQHLLSENVKSPEGRHSSVSSEISSGRDKRSFIVTNCSPKQVVDVGIRTLQKNETTCSNVYLSEEVQTGFHFEQGGDLSICKNSEMGVEENAVMEEYPVCEHEIFLQEKNSCQTLCTMEQRPMADGFCSAEDKISFLYASSDAHTCDVIVMHLPKMLVPVERHSGVFMVETADDSACLSEGAETNLSFEPDGHVECMEPDVGLEENVTKEVLLDGRSFPNVRSSSELTLFLREWHPLDEESSSVQADNLPELPIISASEDHTSVNGDWLRVFEGEKGVSYRTHHSEESETNLSIDGSYYSCKLSELGLEEDRLVQERALIKHLGCLEDSHDLSLCSRKLHLEIKEDANMETIDLSDKDLEECSSIADNQFLYTPSCRPRHFKSYKKLILEAFSSRKRLIKEYKQLPIWYGDFDTETSTLAEKHLLPETPSASNTSQASNAGASDWELL